MKKLFFVLLFVFGCNVEKVVTPTPEGISGVYRSVAYMDYKSYNVKLEILQRGDDLTGTVTTDESYSIKGTMIRPNHARLFFSAGSLDLFLDLNGDYYPLSGQCIYKDEARPIRFEKIGKLHDQGMLLNNINN
jgi:hypothetical protein